jgi:hypothetical protein
MMYLDFCTDERKDDRLEDDPHLLEDGGDGVVVPPPGLTPLHGGHEGQDDGGQAAGSWSRDARIGGQTPLFEYAH